VPEIVPPNAKTLERLIARMPLSMTFPVMEPVVPPLPRCSVPAQIVVPPL
jgi:hypothetical protein